VIDVVSAPETFENELRIIRRSPVVLAIAGLPFMGALALVVAAIAGTPKALLALPHCVVLGALATLFAWRKNYFSGSEAVKVRADARGVMVADRFVPRSRLRAGFVLPGEGRSPRVLLRQRLGLPLELQTGSQEEARALLRALGLDVSQTVADFRILSRARADPMVVFGMTLGVMVLGALLGAAMGSIVRGLGPIFFVIPVLLMTAVLIVPTHLRVGADGFEIRWMSTRRFVRYDEIAYLSRYDKGWGRSRIIGLDLSLRSGETLQLPVQDGNWDSDQIGLIEERIREGQDSLRRGDTVTDAALLERGARGMSDWVAELWAIGTDANVTLRTAPIPKDRLLRVVEDPSLGSSARAAAAVALRADLDDDARARLRVVGESTAEPRLRVAIEKAANGADRSELEAALAEVEGEPHPHAAKA
jgi:hypothetical protein